MCNLPLPLILDDMSPAQPFLRSNGSGTNPTMKGAATPVSARQEEAAHPHLTRLPIDSASASPTSRLRRATLSYPPCRQATSWRPLRCHWKGSRPSFLTATWTGRRRAADRDTARAIDFFIDPFMYPEAIIFYINTINPYIHPNRLSILFPARLCLLMCDIVELT